MKRAKKLVALALLLTVLGAVGCGKAPNSVQGSIGAGPSNGTEAAAPESSPETKKLKDFVIIPLWITSIQPTETKLNLLIGHHLQSVKSVEISYQDVLLDGVSVEDWNIQNQEGEEVFVTEPEMGFSQTLTLGADIENYSELTIQGTAAYDDGTEPYLFSGTFQISELERRIK